MMAAGCSAVSVEGAGGRQIRVLLFPGGSETAAVWVVGGAPDAGEWRL